MTSESNGPATEARVEVMPAQEKPSVQLLAGTGSLRPIGGSAYDTLNNVLANQALGLLWRPVGLSAGEADKRINAAFAALTEFKPQDSIEGMMAVQAIGLHSASVECLRRAMIPEQSSDAANGLRRQAANLSRAFLDVLAALDRKRGKGMQIVRVERVVVHEGGQAIVGNVGTS